MGQKAITIYTPEGTAAHIAAEDDAFIHRSVLGSASGILGSLSCVRVDDNTVRLSGGGVSNRGYILYVPVGETAELSIDSGTAGYNRIDTVAAVFTKGGGNVVFSIIKGTPVTGTPAAPALTSSNLTSAGNVNQLALFYVRITGTAITSISRAAVMLPAGGSGSPGIYVQQAQPASPSTGDLWLW